MKKTIGDYRETLKYLAVKDFNQVKRGIVLNHVHNIKNIIVNGLSDETELPKKAEKHLCELELLAKE